MTVNAPINPAWIAWARERLGMDVSVFSEKMGVSPERVEAWESGKHGITLGQLQRLAALCLQPLGMFFLPDVPKHQATSPEFRTVGGIPVTSPSPELESTILAMRERQTWYRDYLVENGVPPPSALGKLDISASPAAAAAALRAFLGFPEDFAKQFRNSEDFFSAIVDRLETSGVLCVRNGVVGNNTHRPLDVDEFRGFTLFDAYAPLIFINARDSRSAQLFTLVHEAFHLLLGHETLTTDDLLTGDIHDRNERFCNEAAAEFLVPSKELKRMWRNDLERYEQITALARHFKVSRLVMIARCRGLGLLSPKAAAELWVREQAFLASRKKKGGGGDFFRTLVSRISAPFARAILSGVADSTISYTDAFRLLGVKSAKKLDTLNFLLSQRENDALSS